MTEPNSPEDPTSGRSRVKRILLVAALVFFLILFLREIGVLFGSGRFFGDS